MRKALVALVLVAGCGAPNLRPDVPFVEIISRSKPAETPADPKDLTLNEAFALAESLSADLAARKDAVAAAKGRLEQAKTWPNPTLRVGRESITPSSERDNGGDQAQDVIGLNYPIFLGNQRGAAVARAEEEFRLAEAEWEVAQRELRVRVAQAFADALFAQEGLVLSRREQEIAQKLHELAKTRLDAGDIAEREVVRADVDAGRASIRVLDAESIRDQAMLSLGAAIGDRKLQIRAVNGDMALPAIEISFEELERLILEDSPLARRWAALRAVAQGKVREAEAAGWPVLNLSAAYRRYAATDQNTVDLGIDLPLPIFDRRSGAIDAARAELTQTEREILAELTRTLAELAARFRELRSLRERLDVYRKTLIPSTERSLELVSTAYQGREASTLELLDAERSLIEVRRESLEASRAYHRAAADLQKYARRL